MENIKDFVNTLHVYIHYWSLLDVSEKRKMEGLIHSVLVMLDGLCGTYRGDIESLCKNLNKENVLLHEQFYKNEKR